MSDVLISIKPKWCDLIFSGQKIDEIRKTKPKDTTFPITVYVWQTGGGGVIGKFTVREFRFIQTWIDSDGEKHLGNTIGLRHCVDDNELFDYLYRKPKPGKPYSGGWAWRIENPVRFERPMRLDYFNLKRLPQSWQYVDWS